MDMIVRAPREPGPDLGSFVSRIIVHDDMDIEPVGNRAIDLLEEVEEVNRAVPFVAFADDNVRCPFDFARDRNVERCKQRCRAVPHIAVGPALGDAGYHRQNRLLTVQRLYLALLIDAEDDRAGRRR